MKRFFLAVLMITVVSFSFASIAVTTPYAFEQQDEKVKIKNEELPAAVKTTLAGADYKDWTVNAAYHIKAKEQYEVELKKGEETKTVKLDKDGKVVQ